jgi:single-stranded DNA-binding protein
VTFVTLVIRERPWSDPLWITVRCWGALAEKAAKIPKGATVSVDGRIENHRFSDRQGNTIERPEIIADFIDVESL